jgi:tripartite-type tricarboxylate transporter receptor subunit TctC
MRTALSPGNTSGLSRCALSLCAAALCAQQATAQSYPSRPIRIVTSQPGGGGDFISRVVGQAISPALGQPVIIDNRGGGVLPAIYVSTATPDGYTLVGSSGVLWTGPFMQKVAYDPVRDFAPISLAVRAPNVLVVQPTLGPGSVKELITLAKARPGQLNYASAGAGGSAHLSGALFKSMAGIDIVLVPYKGAGPALNALFSGEVQIMFATTTAATPHVHSGRLRALAVTTAEPTALLPGVPTMAASGLPGYESATITGFLAPAKTPVAIIRRLNSEIVRVLRTEEIRDRFLKSGVETVGNTPEEYARVIRADMARFGKVIAEAGIRPE